jgi:hypothetical protein
MVSQGIPLGLASWGGCIITVGGLVLAFVSCAIILEVLSLGDYGPLTRVVVRVHANTRPYQVPQKNAKILQNQADTNGYDWTIVLGGTKYVATSYSLIGDTSLPVNTATLLWVCPPKRSTTL